MEALSFIYNPERSKSNVYRPEWPMKMKEVYSIAFKQLILDIKFVVTGIRNLVSEALRESRWR